MMKFYSMHRLHLVLCLISSVLFTTPAWAGYTLAPNGPSSKGKIVGLVIGVGKTQRRDIAPLPGVATDVKRVARQLRVQFRADEITTLVNEQATKKNILAAMKQLASTLGKKDQLFFYFSGYGSRVNDLEGDETHDKLDETLVPYDISKKRSSHLRDDELIAWLQTLKTKKVVLLLDACHNGGRSKGVGIKYWPNPDMEQSSAFGNVTYEKNRGGFRALLGVLSMHVEAKSRAKGTKQAPRNNRLQRKAAGKKGNVSVKKQKLPKGFALKMHTMGIIDLAPPLSPQGKKVAQRKTARRHAPKARKIATTQRAVKPKSRKTIAPPAKRLQPSKKKGKKGATPMRPLSRFVLLSSSQKGSYAYDGGMRVGSALTSAFLREVSKEPNADVRRLVMAVQRDVASRWPMKPYAIGFVNRPLFGSRHPPLSLATPTASVYGCKKGLCAHFQMLTKVHQLSSTHLRNKEEFKIFFRTNQRAFVAILSIDYKGKVVNLFPRMYFNVLRQANREELKKAERQRRSAGQTSLFFNAKHQGMLLPGGFALQRIGIRVSVEKSAFAGQKRLTESLLLLAAPTPQGLAQMLKQVKRLPNKQLQYGAPFVAHTSHLFLRIRYDISDSRSFSTKEVK